MEQRARDTERKSPVGVFTVSAADGVLLTACVIEKLIQRRERECCFLGVGFGWISIEGRRTVTEIFIIKRQFLTPDGTEVVLFLPLLSTRNSK